MDGLKKTILKETQGLEKFTWSDRNAPIDIGGGGGGDDTEEEEKISWPKAVEIVERGYRKFSGRMADLFLSMINENRIDVPATNAKRGGAYCAGVIPSVVSLALCYLLRLLAEILANAVFTFVRDRFNCSTLTEPSMTLLHWRTNPAMVGC